MKEVRLPALTGDSALGILAAIGTMRLLAEFVPASKSRLRWERHTLTAVLCGWWTNENDVVADLWRVVETISEGSVLPGVGPGFPPPGAAPDGLRVMPEKLRSTTDSLLHEMPRPERYEGQRWLASLVTDLAVDKSGRVAISQFTAPAGKQSMSTMLEKPLEQIRKNPDYLRQALMRWRRVPGVTGENLDHRAMWDATEDGGGNASMRGVPGATWLALMSYPLLRTTVSARGRPISTGWHTTRSKTGRTYEELRLPVWEQPLGPQGVTALLEHPAMTLDAEVDRARSHPELETLGVFHVCRSRRHQPSGSQSAGILMTVT